MESMSRDEQSGSECRGVSHMRCHSGKFILRRNAL
jgi:hypothetical protein